MKTAEQMPNLAKVHFGPRARASLRLKGLSPHSLMFTLETETAQNTKVVRVSSNKQTSEIGSTQHNTTEVHTQITKELVQGCYSNNKSA